MDCHQVEVSSCLQKQEASEQLHICPYYNDYLGQPPPLDYRNWTALICQTTGGPK